ncbi:MAG: crossover junction endodeoxyribonuclease RuvC, partial [Ruminococcus sp.]|nr:crossover junction endodeoxyribonuclease RuvC [Ruminococcus sp.]
VLTNLSAAKRHKPVTEYTPLQVKVSVTGYGKAEKRQMMEMTRSLLGLANIPKPDDAADALAVAICHGHSVRWR